MPNKGKLNVVLDSVVVVSAFLTEGLTSKLLSHCRKNANLYTTDEILQEIRSVLLEKNHIRSHYTYPDTKVKIFVKRLREKSTIVKQLPTLHVIERDPKDDKILACAVVARADYLVSRDLDLLDLAQYQGIRIVTPETFIRVLREH